MLRRPAPRNSTLEAAYRTAGYWSGESFFHLFEATCKRLENRTVLVDGLVRLSYASVRARALRLAGGLARLGVKPGSVVAIQLPNWWETVIAYWATIRLGAVLNPILPAYRERELEFILREGGAEVLFVPATHRKFDHRPLANTLRDNVPSLREVVVVRGSAGPGQLTFDELEDGPLPAAPHGEDLLLLMYTSGTTADPKGVLHSHQTLLYEIRSLGQVHALDDQDVVLMPSPLTHVSGLIHATLLPFALGTRAVLMESWDPNLAIDRIRSEGVTYMVGAPIFLSDLTFHPNLAAKPTSTLRLFSCGGAGVSPDLIRESRRRLGCVSKRVYGSTEYPTLTTTSPDDPEERSATTEGRAIGAAELRIVDETGRDLSDGIEGEILARGPDCFLGYRNPDLDADGFTEEGWFRTGDLGIRDAGGFLTVTGRKKDIVIRKGEKISAAEVEAVTRRHPAIEDVAVVALPDPSTGERVCACVLLATGASLDLEGLTSFLREQGLAAHKLPERLVLVDDLPRTASGKVQKHRLQGQISRE